MLGKNQNSLISPLKKKDLMNDFKTLIGGGSLKEQECETDEGETELISKL